MINLATVRYHIADIDIQHHIFSSWQGDFVSVLSRYGTATHKETLELKVQYAAEEVAHLLINWVVTLYRSGKKRLPRPHMVSQAESHRRGGVVIASMLRKRTAERAAQGTMGAEPLVFEQRQGDEGIPCGISLGKGMGFAREGVDAIP